MIKAITQDQLILLAYNELPPGKQNELMKRVKADDTTYANYLNLKADMGALDSLKSRPNPTSIQIVLEESCSSSYMEMI